MCFLKKRKRKKISVSPKKKKNVFYEVEEVEEGVDAI